jgi:UDP-glucose 4-epimerase
MKMLDRIDQGLPPILHGDGRQAHDFIYVGDCARANVCAMKSDATDRAYNVASGKKTSLRELAHAAFEVLGKTPEIRYEPLVKWRAAHMAEVEQRRREAGVAAERR